MLIAGCRSDAGFATLTANAPEATPTQEVQTPRPSATAPVLVTVTPTQEQIILWQIEGNHNGQNYLSTMPECSNRGCSYDLHLFGGTVGTVMAEGYQVGQGVCYMVTATADLNVADNTCEDAVNNYAWIMRAHYSNGRAGDWSAPIGLRSGVFDDYNGDYDLVWGIVFKSADIARMEVALRAIWPCANFGNEVAIRDVAIQPAPDAGYCQ
jgi:hypothetical protein